MQPTTPAFGAAVAASHRIVTRADLWYDGALVAADLPVVDGELAVDDDAAVRSRVTCTVADRYGTLVPAIVAGTGGIDVYGHEIHLRSGISIPGGPEELVSLGWFRIQQVDIGERFRRLGPGRATSGGAVLKVDALDRASTVDRARFLAPESAPPGATCLGEIRRLAQGIVPLAAFPAGPDPAVPADLSYGDNRLAALVALAAAAAVRVYVDRDGNLTVRPLAALAGRAAAAPDWTLTGDAAGALVGYDLVQSADNAYNAVVARGEAIGDSAPVQGIAYDTDPASPTRWDGPYGRVPAFYASPLITTQAQADSAARTRLDGLLRGRDRTVAVAVVPNPAAEPGATVTRIITPRLTLTGLLVSMTLPLAASGGPARLAVRVPQTGITPTNGSSGNDAHRSDGAGVS